MVVLFMRDACKNAANNLRTQFFRGEGSIVPHHHTVFVEQVFKHIFSIGFHHAVMVVAVNKNEVVLLV
jgi:hypothetical protein